jgi:hypothetical protein
VPRWSEPPPRNVIRRPFAAAPRNCFSEPVIPGEHYALTEVVRCGSENERIGDVGTAARFCVRKYLFRTLELSGARVIVAVGDHAMRAFPKVLPVKPGGGVQQVTIATRDVLISFLPGPGAGKSKTFEKTHEPKDREWLKAALASR